MLKGAIPGATLSFYNLTNFNPANAGPYNVTVASGPFVGVFYFLPTLINTCNISMACTNKTVLCNTAWTFDSPSAVSGCCSSR